MARATKALPAADGLFKEGWTRSRGRAGGRGLKSMPFRPHRQMARAAAGNRAAVFKLIARGGCRTTQQLHGQLEYLLGKADAVLDSRGIYEQEGPLSSQDALSAAERWSQDWRGETRTGQTSHMVMSFPVGTDTATVRAISERICERFFEGDGARHFDTHKTLAEALRADLHAGVRCLVKGSRGSAMDKIVTALLAEGEGKPHAA